MFVRIVFPFISSNRRLFLRLSIRIKFQTQVLSPLQQRLVISTFPSPCNIKSVTPSTSVIPKFSWAYESPAKDHIPNLLLKLDMKL